MARQEAYQRERRRQEKARKDHEEARRAHEKQKLEQDKARREAEQESVRKELERLDKLMELQEMETDIMGEMTQNNPDDDVMKMHDEVVLRQQLEQERQRDAHADEYARMETLLESLEK